MEYLRKSFIVSGRKPHLRIYVLAGTADLTIDTVTVAFHRSGTQLHENRYSPHLLVHVWSSPTPTLNERKILPLRRHYGHSVAASQTESSALSKVAPIHTTKGKKVSLFARDFANAWVY